MNWFDSLLNLGILMPLNHICIGGNLMTSSKAIIMSICFVVSLLVTFPFAIVGAFGSFYGEIGYALIVTVLYFVYFKMFDSGCIINDRKYILSILILLLCYVEHYDGGPMNTTSIFATGLEEHSQWSIGWFGFLRIFDTPISPVEFIGRPNEPTGSFHIDYFAFILMFHFALFFSFVSRLVTWEYNYYFNQDMISEIQDSISDKMDDSN